MAEGRGALVAALVVAVAFTALGIDRWWAPWATTEREVVAATPALGGLFQRKIVDVMPGSTACIGNLRVAPEMRQARLRLSTGGPPAIPIRVELRAGAHRSSDRLSRYPTGTDYVATFDLEPPPEATQGELCVVNEHRGDEWVGLVGTDEGRSQTIATLQLDGREVEATDVELTFLTGERSSLLSRTGEVLRHASALTGGAVPPWLAWVLLVLVAAGLPLGALTAFWLTARRST